MNTEFFTDLDTSSMYPTLPVFTEAMRHLVIKLKGKIYIIWLSTLKIVDQHFKEIESFKNMNELINYVIMNSNPDEIISNQQLLFETL